MLEVAYERNVRRIAAEVGERPRGSLYLAVGKSAEVRAAVEAALGERGIAVAGVTLAEDEGPWARIVAAQEQSGRDAGEVIVSVAGLGEVAEDKVERVLAHLNLGRELRVTHRLHVLLWVGGLEGLDRFRTVAPDLWGHRSGVILFLSSDDFEIALKGNKTGDMPKSINTVLHEVEEQLALSPQPNRQIELLAQKTRCLKELERASEALQTLEEAESLLAKGVMSPWEQARAQARILAQRSGLLRDLGRTQEALEYVKSKEQHLGSEPLLYYAISEELAKIYSLQGHTKESTEHYTQALKLAPWLAIRPVNGRAPNFINRAETFAAQGMLDAAARDVSSAFEELKKLQQQDEIHKTWQPTTFFHADYVLTYTNQEQGNTLKSLALAHQNAKRILDLGSKRFFSTAIRPIANIYLRLGLHSSAQSFAHQAIENLEHSPSELAWWTRWFGAREADKRNDDAAVARYEAAVTLYRSAAGVEPRQDMRARWLREAAHVLYESLAPLLHTARYFQQAQDLLIRAAASADEANSPEQRALTQRCRAELARAAKQWDHAEAEYLAFLTWAEANWGPYKRAEVLLDLAGLAYERGDLPHAAAHAVRAQREVAIDPPEYRNRYTAIAAEREIARIRKAMGDLQAAHAALHAALTLAQADGLRLRERTLLLDLAELPPLPGSPDQRIEHAQRARTIAQDAAFPVDEAEAMLVLAELHLDAGRARRARALFEQAVWIVDRIGPTAVRERAARVRAKLDG